ncbi:pentapeptide repeat-containing protein [Clostridium hydrogenum]|uniref:pentapeptide repeat-containing protein n=1 Tax=Clostridium hydrogenum TaxID=2855764 RepID=UPI001F290638|nr:pentapeptide repeat-containing protein [Clostridium hydrogenum]
MIDIHEDKIIKELKIDCEKCFGLCCTALYFSASEGFPNNKDAGKPCINLQSDFTCSVHKKLSDKGLKGCTAYDCFGAGQKLAQVTFKGQSWRENKESANKMFEAFLIMRQLHEMMWYLIEAFNLQTNNEVKKDISLLIEETERFTILDVDLLVAVDVEAHRDKVNLLLRNTSELIRAKAHSGNKKTNCHRTDYFGKDLRKANLRGADLRGACLIAANLRGVDLSSADLIGADLRDTDFSGANLANSIFLTQAQINAAKGDLRTRLPKMIVKPSNWKD